MEKSRFGEFDWILLVSVMSIPLLGLVVLYSAGYDPDLQLQPFSWLPLTIQSMSFAKQSLHILIGFVLMLSMMLMPPAFLCRISYIIFAAGIGLLLLVLAIGTVSNGSQRWISIAGVRYQPSELIKPAIILALARYISRHVPPENGYRLRGLIIPGLLIGVPTALIMKQPDLGTGLLVLATGSSMLLFAGIYWKTLLMLVTAAIGMVIPGWIFLLKPYQKRRILTLFNPDADPLGSGYHIIQSKIAVGSGALTGKGFLQGTQTQLEFLPEHTTDFVFSVLAEEWGFIGCVFIFGLYFFCIYRMLRVVGRSKDLYCALVVFGIVASLFFHIVVNIGMVIGIMPVVGLPLPLFSYGGTAIVTTLASTGLVLGIAMRRISFLKTK